MTESYGDMKRLTDYAAAQIERLQDDGIKLEPAHILNIAAIGRLIESPTARLELARGRPISVGGVTLRPLTIAASDWFQRHQAELGQLGLYGLAYAMAHGRDPMPEVNVRKAVKAWSKSIRCRAKELDEACQQVLSQDEQPDTGESAKINPTFGDLSAILTAVCGGPPEMWEYQCSVRYANEVLAHQLAVMSEGDANKARRMEYEKAMAEYVWNLRHGKA